MGVPAHFSKRQTQEYERKITSAKIRAHNRENLLENTSAKSQTQKITKNTSAKSRAQNSKFYILEISWKPHIRNFLETICWEIFWKLYAGNLLMETMCWEIQVDASGFLKGGNSGNYGTMLGSADLSRMMRSKASEVIGSVEQGDGDTQLMMVPK